MHSSAPAVRGSSATRSTPFATAVPSKYQNHVEVGIQGTINGVFVGLLNPTLNDTTTVPIIAGQRKLEAPSSPTEEFQRLHRQLELRNAVRATSGASASKSPQFEAVRPIRGRRGSIARTSAPSKQSVQLARREVRATWWTVSHHRTQPLRFVFVDCRC